MTTTPSTTAGTLADPDTPFAVVDVHKALRNIDRLAAKADHLGVTLRPHVKTAKSLDVAALMHGAAPNPVTVSTLAEAEAFADGGYADITYAVGIDPHKLPRVLALLRRGVTLRVLLDSPEQAAFVAEASRRSGIGVPAQIEIDCDSHRGGLKTDAPALLDVGRTLHDAGCLDGVLTHAGESYFAYSADERRLAAKNERDTAVAAAESLRAAGLPVATVSVGSTPTAHAAEDLTGVTELRAGNYVFFDLVMAGLGVCRIDDLALSVVVTVIGHRPEYGWIVTDGGWMAMSRDRGTAAQPKDQGYGLVTDLTGRTIPGLVMSAASQEHGTITARDGAALPDLPIGTRLRILPNHACATAAQHRGYHVIDSSRTAADAPAVQAVWNRVSGW
ncbi:DSD1 family PLP-dependent enzyme [Streptomyces rapamycinicus]|uniref:Alanine racemase n=2 Tax=Streptomyces rapamycinicus TaxID=1226757 RepID=A0A0A0N715_STRRN|nr:DSD1 family PLP-dependent enzyme [Streptomyces rapamycinicus]AGP52304.1 alanine racemase [Streptomyces rapamycinicus NRRL 5491]MBB4779766.1 D-serine deaminase-like pyridoxal phosphate-dependent protein [Streptomyces rapamycinicus]RLV75576.1 alanine racemase [Streptomyces rapamycinicus NRRL 5491]UTP28490.1 DSD1 family PLP-dependent enzyme [Streptomyces rapamycinicus NRRL 5491]